MDDARPGGALVEAGLLKPTKTGLPFLERIRQMGQDLAGLIQEKGVEAVVIEITSGKVGKKRHGGGGAGLAIYGLAVGYFLHECERHGVPVVPVLENVWTGGVSKQTRTRGIAALYRTYKPAADPGGDIADAIGLGRWYLQERRFRKRVAR